MNVLECDLYSKKENKTSPGNIQSDKHILNLELMHQHV